MSLHICVPHVPACFPHSQREQYDKVDLCGSSDDEAIDGDDSSGDDDNDDDLPSARPPNAAVSGKLDRYFGVGGGVEQRSRFFGVLRDPGGRATHKDAEAAQRAWQYYSAFMRRQCPGRFSSKRGDFQLWDLRPSSKAKCPSRDDWLSFTHFMRSSCSSYESMRVDVSRVVAYGKRLAVREMAHMKTYFPEDVFDPRVV